MGMLKPETVKLIANEMYDYDLPDDAARSIAHGAGALLTNAYHLATAFNLGALEPPFGYPVLEAEAARIKSSGGKGR